MDLKKFLENKLVEEKYFLTNNIENKSSRQSLWHGIKIENAKTALENMKLEPHTSQRYWPDGKRLKDDHPNYEDSFWMYGWSMTRKKEYAMNWAGVVFEFDHEKIQQQFEIKPFAWNFLFKHNKGIQKKEFEEFVISSYFEKSIPQLKREQEEKDVLIDSIYESISKEKDEIIKEKLKNQRDKLLDIPSWMNIWQSPKGRSLDLNSCLKGVYIDEFLIGLNCKENDFIINHPKFKGVFVADIDKQEKRKKLKI